MAKVIAKDVTAIRHYLQKILNKFFLAVQRKLEEYCHWDIPASPLTVLDLLHHL